MGYQSEAELEERLMQKLQGTENFNLEQKAKFYDKIVQVLETRPTEEQALIASRDIIVSIMSEQN